MSIIGNPIMASCGKNISSIIITGLLSTDTVTCAKDGNSYPVTWDETERQWEIVRLPLGTFTITSTRGTNVITEEVLIDVSGIYEIEMVFKLYLYNLGDECTDLTGGWYAYAYCPADYTSASSGNSEQAPSFTKNTTNMVSSTPAARMGSILTANVIDLTNYTKLCWEGYQIGYVDGGGHVVIPESKSSKYRSLKEVRIKNLTHVEVNISDISGSKYLGILNGHSYADKNTVSITTEKMWLE